jgi:hypothetical protein
LTSCIGWLLDVSIDSLGLYLVDKKRIQNHPPIARKTTKNQQKLTMMKMRIS